jgi:tetratricopeptide (TPR) repeat protein
MDVVTIQDVGIALAILASEVSKGTAKEIGKDLWVRAKSLFTWTRNPEELSPDEIRVTVEEQLQQQPDLLSQLTELLKQSGHVTTTTLNGKNVLTMDGVQVGGDFHYHAQSESAAAKDGHAVEPSAAVSEPVPESEFFADREAGKRPAASNIPYSRNRNYQDREPSVDDLRKALREEGAAIVQAVHGQGGVGKTQLASEYVYCTAIDGTDYDVAWWLDCGLTDNDRSPNPTGEPPALAAGFVALAAKLPLPDKVRNADDPQVIIDAVRGWLEMNDGWLLVFDNVVEEAHLRPYLPKASRGHVIITSRSSHWSSAVAALPVSPFEPDMARDFLLKLSGSQDAAAAEALAEELGCLPLALAQAGHYVRETHGSLSRYLKDFQANRLKALQRKSSLDAYEQTIYDTFDLSIRAVQQKSKAAVSLMSLCSFFARRDIPLSLLEADPTVLPKSLRPTVRDSDKLNDALRTLKQFGLIDIQNEALSLHTLIHFIARERLNKQQTRRWIEASVRLLAAALPENVATDLSTWPIFECLSPHAMAAVDHADPQGAQEADMVAQAGSKGVQEGSKGAQDGASAAQDGASAAQEGSSGLQGSIRASQGEASTAQEGSELVQEATNGADGQRLSGSEAAEVTAVQPRGIAPDATGRLCNEMGLYRKLRAQFSQAEPLYHRALEIDEQSLGPQHPTVATDLNNLAQLLQATNRLEQAEPLYRRALAINEDAYPADHPAVALSCLCVGYLLKATNRLEQAEPLYRRALEIWEESLGEDHPQVAAGLNNLALLLQATNRLDQAEPLMRRALEIFQASLGDEHPNTQTVAGNLQALLKQKAGDE